MISGTPSEVGTTIVTITVTDANGASAPLPAVTVEVNAPDTSELGVLTYEVGTAIDPLPLPDDATLQQLGGGTPPYTISVSGLPAGVSFDEATRIISGTPSEVGTTIVIVTITDANGASASLPPFNIEVALPPLGAPNILLAQDYKGADGSGDQGGFLLLTWPLSKTTIRWMAIASSAKYPR